MKRDILKIDEEKCNGCGLCVPNCHEGALQVIDGKVRLVSELMCDGLGACIGHCPEGAITIETREAEPYNEIKVMEQMIDKGKNTIIAHLKHLKDHGETGFLQEGVNWLKENRNRLNFPLEEVTHEVHGHGSALLRRTAADGESCTCESIKENACETDDCRDIRQCAEGRVGVIKVQRRKGVEV